MKSFLPKQVYEKSHQHGKFSEISSVASVILIRVAGWTSIFKQLTPSQTIELTNQIISSIEEIALKYPQVMLVPSSPGTYMATVGLLSGIHKPDEFSKIAIRFGKECILLLQQLSASFHTQIQVIIGIDTGGPIRLIVTTSSGNVVLGIYGEPVITATYLAHYGDHDKIHITKAVKDYIEGISFKFRETGMQIQINGKNLSTFYVEN